MIVITIIKNYASDLKYNRITEGFNTIYRIWVCSG